MHSQRLQPGEGMNAHQAEQQTMGGAVSATQNVEDEALISRQITPIVTTAPLSEDDIAKAKQRLDAAPDRGCSLLFAAAERGDAFEVKALVAAGVSTASSDPNGHNALHRACRGGHEEVAEALIAADIGCVHAASVLGHTPLHAAVFVGNKRLVSLLLRSNADPTAADAAGDQPIHRATSENQRAVVEALLKGGASASAIGAGGNTPLHMVAPYCDDLGLVELLLTHDDGAMAVVNQFGMTALQLARFHGNARLATRLAQATADAKAPG
eukprot:1834380-Prymnesium_polylepis.1